MGRNSNLAEQRETVVPVFAALGDGTRLSLIAKLAGGQTRTIAQLTEGSQITRQAITKHLRVLERAGIVHNRREGRESRFALDTKRIDDLRAYLDQVSNQWDNALSRLKDFVEQG
ncbi:MAG: helix-turn-helix transcriptional regulator [Candidatus Hydrogenedentes bacterium]|nr:helix-turn-helix transcriptional regulator [Candidatus Hydrogenedentota bacterium]